jgi:hypothetical protein
MGNTWPIVVEPGSPGRATLYSLAGRRAAKAAVTRATAHANHLPHGIYLALPEDERSTRPRKVIVP